MSREALSTPHSHRRAAFGAGLASASSCGGAALAFAVVPGARSGAGDVVLLRGEVTSTLTVSSVEELSAGGSVRFGEPPPPLGMLNLWRARGRKHVR